MDGTAALLFGGFPRRVGTPKQHWVFNEAQFDVFAETVDGARNAYATVCRMDLAEGPVADKVFFDLDGDKSALPDDAPADARIGMMRDDPDLADAVLGDVCEDAEALARASMDDGIPVVGVFSGFGIHVYQLYQPTTEPKTPMATCGAKYIEELELQTADWTVVGDIQRIARVPNMERATYNTDQFDTVLDGRPTGLYTIPLSPAKLVGCTPQSLLEASRSPEPGLDSFADERPQMPVWEEYREHSADGDTDGAAGAQRPVDQRTMPLDEAGVRRMLEDLLQMPCMVERITQPNPEHEVRINCAVLLFNVGLNPQQVESLYAKLGWVDWNRNITRSHLDYIYRNGYSDMTCKSIRERKLCVKEGDAAKKACNCYGWSGGRPEWKS